MFRHLHEVHMAHILFVVLYSQFGPWSVHSAQNATQGARIESKPLTRGAPFPAAESPSSAVR